METKEQFSVKKALCRVTRGKFIMGAHLPLGYAPGFPMLVELGNKLCLQVLYWKCVVTGEKNRNFVFPVKYVAVFTIPDLVPVKFIDLQYEEEFKFIDFSRPVGVFPHQAVEKLNRQEYFALKDKIYNEVDAIVDSRLKGESCNDVEVEFKKLYGRMIEPSLQPFYKAVNTEFFEKYIE